MSDTSKASVSEATAKVFIARQDTLESVKSTAESVKSTAESVKNTTENVKSTADSIKSTAEGTRTTVNTINTAVKAVQASLDGEALPPLWIAEYKLHGENCYVFRDADVLARMYKSTAAVNDPVINGEALEFVLKNPGKASLSDWLKRLSDTRANGASLFSGVETAAQLAAKSSAMTAVAGSRTAMEAISRSKTAMVAITASSSAFSKITASAVARELVANSNAALWAILNNSTAAGTVEASDLWNESLAASNLLKGFTANGNNGTSFVYEGMGYAIYYDNRSTADRSINLTGVVTGGKTDASINVPASTKVDIRRFFKTRAQTSNMANYSQVRYIPISEEV